MEPHCSTHLGLLKILDAELYVAELSEGIVLDLYDCCDGPWFNELENRRLFVVWRRQNYLKREIKYESPS